MAEFQWFGGGPGINTSDCYMVDAAGNRVPGAAVVITDATTGEVLTDLLDSTGTAVSGISSGDLGYLTFAARVPIVDVTSGAQPFRFVSNTAVEAAAGVASSVVTLASAAAAAAVEAAAASVAAQAAQASATASAAIAAGAAPLASPHFTGTPLVNGLPIGTGTGSTDTLVGTFSFGGTLVAPTIGSSRWYNPTTRALTFVQCRASVDTVPTGSPVIVDVTKNGTTIFTTRPNRASIPAGQNTALSAAPQVTGLAVGEYLKIDIDEVGSTFAGANLTVTVVYQ